MKKIVAVLGAGNAGKALAVDAALGGHSVRLFEFPEFARSIESLKRHRKIELIGPQMGQKNFKRDGVGTMDVVTTDMKEAIAGAEIIAISVQSHGFERLFREMVPHLEDGQVITIYPDNFASLILRRIMREMGCDRKVIVGGWSSLPYGARVVSIDEPNVVNVLYRAVGLRGDAMPNCDAPAFFEAMKEFAPMDTVDPIPGDTIVDVGFCNVNPILHVPAVLLNLGTIDNWGVIDKVGEKDVYYNIYKHGFSENISKIQYQIYQEEKAICDKMGIDMQDYPREQFFSRLSILGPEFMGEGYSTPLDENMPAFWNPIYFPGERFTHKSRYVTEDIPVGINLFLEFGKRFEVETPIIESMLKIGNVVSETDYSKSGFTLETLGLDRLDNEQMMTYLRTGVYEASL